MVQLLPKQQVVQVTIRPPEVMVWVEQEAQAPVVMSAIPRPARNFLIIPISMLNFRWSTRVETVISISD